MFLDTYGEIKSCKSKDSKCNYEKKKFKTTNCDWQSTTWKTNDQATLSNLYMGVNSGAPEGLTVILLLYYLGFQSFSQWVYLMNVIQDNSNNGLF